MEFDAMPLGLWFAAFQTKVVPLSSAVKLDYLIRDDENNIAH
jgi:hypothetical protein